MEGETCVSRICEETGQVRGSVDFLQTSCGKLFEGKFVDSLQGAAYSPTKQFSRYCMGIYAVGARSSWECILVLVSLAISPHRTAVGVSLPHQVFVPNDDGPLILWEKLARQPVAAT